MKPFTELKSIAAPLDKANVDTDQIIPKQFLKKIERSGFGKHLFHDWRFLDDEGKKQNPEFILNQEPYTKSEILLARDNFGCGSSREHAPWALEDFGIRSIIAPSYADIFYNNCFKNGILPVRLQNSEVEELFGELHSEKGARIDVNLQSKTVTSPSGKTYTFQVDDFLRNCLLKGLDDISLTLLHEKEITAFEEKQKAEKPWLYEALVQR